MSVKTNIKTELNDKGILRESLAKLNVNFTEHALEEKCSVKDYYNKKASDRVVLKISDYVGFEQEEDGKLTLVGDTHYERGLFSNADQAVSKVTQVYQSTQIALAIEESGNLELDIDESNIDVNANEIVVVANVLN